MHEQKTEEVLEKIKSEDSQTIKKLTATLAKAEVQSKTPPLIHEGELLLSDSSSL
jgi:hypothetical protein